ncbi:MFS family transporter [Plastoroseomonas arctica]|uniref:Alpha-ketoglutarate permease n=1 Tax=Plastoroseomonas arctica TaxID=1509237 RepID=A0AAF1KHW5_9PROT|nr:MFS family transporter [Plastoroseomonas arctica]MBR0654404.1 MFS transporter [Plastoroseomonas arctica]
MSSIADASAISGEHETRRRVVAIVASSSGNLVEWYDFYVYSFFSLYFAHAFFPASDPTVQLLSAAGVFAAGFLMRPIGGWLFGMLADRRGRKFSMMLSVLMMCGGSLMIAVLPTYDSIGIAAPALLLLARLLQGLSVGGEYGTSATYMSEVAGSHNRGFFSSFQYVTLIGGQLLAVLVAVALEQSVGEQALRDWAWRIPFLIGAAAALVALFLRRSLHETGDATTLARKDAGTLRALIAHPRSVLVTLGITAGGSLIFYTFTTYMQKYLVNTVGYPAKQASVMMLVALFVYMLMQPLFGALSDRIGRRPQMLAFGVLGTLAVLPLMTAISGSGGQPVLSVCLVLAALAIVSLYTSISGVVKAELFPAQVRALGVGFCYAIANAMFGGTAEYVGLNFKAHGIESGFYWYVAAMMAIVLVATIAMPDPRRLGHMEAAPPR